MKRRLFFTALAILAITTVKAQDIAVETNDRINNADPLTSDMYIYEMYYSKFVKYPTFRVKLEPGSLAIDPAKVIPFGEEGYLYPAKKLKGDWGKLSSNGFVMLSKDFKYLMLTIPRDIDGKMVNGDDWELTIKGSYYILRNQADNNFYLIKG